MADLRSLRSKYPDDEAVVSADGPSTHQEACQRLEKHLLDLGSIIDRVATPVSQEKFDTDVPGFRAVIGRCLILAEALKRRMSDIAERLGHE